jgi:transcriptional regulator with XRE-family HTH domain
MSYDEFVEFDPDKFSDWMKTAREKNGLTWYGLAALTGMHATTLSTIEQHGRDVRMSSFVKICTALNENPATVMKKVLA